MLGHGGKARHAAKRKACQAAHVELLPIRLGKVFFEWSIDLVAAKGRGQQCRFAVAVLFQRSRRLGHELGISQCARKGLLDKFLDIL